MPILPGTRLGPYEVTAQIGAGGMGEVYKARDEGRRLLVRARHPDMRVLQAIWDRILKAAEGAAMGTGTRFEHEVITS